MTKLITGTMAVLVLLVGCTSQLTVFSGGASSPGIATKRNVRVDRCMASTGATRRTESTLANRNIRCPESLL